MRRISALVLVGLGTFLLITGIGLRVYAYPRLAQAPKDQNSVTALSATGATVFDVTKLEQITTDLDIQATTRGDVAASDAAPDGVVVWVGTTTVRKADGGILSQDTQISPMDANTAEAVNCCGSAVDVVNGVGTPIERQGLVWKFPFDTQQQDYQVWDDTLGATATATFAGEDTIDGLKVYKFVQDTPETVVGSREVPASILGLSQDGNVNADSTYQVNRTFYVEPNIGAIIKRVDEQKAALSYDDAELITTEGTIAYTDAQVQTLVDDYKTKATLLAGVHSTYALIGGILGLIALAAGLFFGRGSNAGRKA